MINFGTKKIIQHSSIIIIGIIIALLGAYPASAQNTVWVLTDTQINASGDPTSKNGTGPAAGSTDTWTVTATSLGHHTKSVWNGFTQWDRTFTFHFNAPPSQLTPGENISMIVNGTANGTVESGFPAADFTLWAEGATLAGETAAHLDNEQNSSTATATLQVPEVSSGQLKIGAFLWNCAACNVTWIFEAGEPSENPPTQESPPAEPNPDGDYRTWPPPFYSPVPLIYRSRGVLIPVEGNIYIFNAGLQKWYRVRGQVPIYTGDVVKSTSGTGKIYAHEGGVSIAVSPDTLIQVPLSEEEMATQDQWDTFLWNGVVSIKRLFTGEIQGRNPWVADTVQITTATRGTEYVLEYDEEFQESIVMLKEGELDITEKASNTTTLLTAGTTYLSSGGETFTYAMTDSDWNHIHEVMNMPLDVEPLRLSDISGHSNMQAILGLLYRGIISGYPDGTFKPDNDLNRAELLKILVHGTGGAPSVEDYQECFPDVHNQWFAPYVCYALAEGWVDGYPDGTFKPANPVNKAEAMKMLFNSQELNIAVEPDSVPFSDTPMGEWYTPFVNAAYEKGLLQESDLYYPAENMKRATIAENIYRAVRIYEESMDTFSTTLYEGLVMG